MTTDPVDLGSLIDHHCHGLVLEPLDRHAFESMLNEGAAAAPGTTFFDSMLGIAIRRWCAPVIGLAAHSTADDYLARRRELGATASQLLLAASGIDTFLVDTGIGDDRVCPPSDLASMVAGTAVEVVRLEKLAEDLLAAGGSGDFAERFEQALRDSGAIATKSIAAYRTGLNLPAHRPTRQALAAGLTRVRLLSTGRPRIADPVISGWLAWTAVDLGMPLQIHVGYGDSDLDLSAADPLRLTGFARATEARGVPVLLLHNYPFHRQAAYLAQAFQHIYIDLGLAVHNTGALSTAVIRETLELVPFGKLLFSSDAYGLAELYYLAAELFRRGLSAVFAELVDAGEMSRNDAARAGGLIARDNARRVYPRLAAHSSQRPE